MDQLSPWVFAAPLAVLLLLLVERASPWRREAAPLRHRWLTNLGLMLIVGAVVGVVFSHDLPALAEDLPSGALRDLGLPLWVESILVVLLLDGWRYWEHRYFHEIPLLWRTHLVHHSDTALDITTAERHHPFEAILVTSTGMLLLFAFGFSAQALGIYLTLATLSAFWTHASIRLPERLDRALRLVLVTPAVHRIHHSTQPSETDSNYGTLLTLWDRFFGTYVDPDTARVPGYGLEYFHLDEDTALGPVLLQPFEYRRQGGFYPARNDNATVIPSDSQLTPMPAAWRRALLQLCGCLVFCAAALWPSWVSLFDVWRSSEYQYAWLILPALAYILFGYHREYTLSLAPRQDHLGLALLIPGALLWLGASLIDLQLGQHLALVLILQGLVLCILGRHCARALLPALALLLLMVPSGDLLQAPLRQLTVQWIEWFALVFGMPHEVEGFVVWVGDHRYVVIDACSGLAFVLMGGFLGYCFGLLLSLSLWRAAALGLVGAILGIATNGMRVWLILGVDSLRGTQLDMAGHTDLQWLALLTCMGLLLYLVVRAAGGAGDHYESARIARQPPSEHRQSAAPLLAGIAVIAAVGALQLADRLAPKAAGGMAQAMAATFPDSRAEDPASGPDRSLVIPWARHLEAVVVTPTDGRGRVQERRFYPQDLVMEWRHVKTGQLRDCVQGECINFVHKVFRRRGTDDERHAFYAFFVGDLVTDSRLDYRIANGWQRIRGNAPVVGALGFRVTGDAPADSELARAFLHIHGLLRGRDVVLNTAAAVGAEVATPLLLNR